jgi:uncharacterized repeat protein (TIGR01451 family)
MAKNNISRALSSLLFVASTAVFSSSAHAATLQFGVTQTQTGGLVGLLNVVGDDYCPTASSPGCDFSSTDNIIRTNDDINFQIDVAVGPAGDDPIVMTSVLDPGLIWSALPSSCNAFTSSITGDGTAASPSIISCDLGAQASWASSFNVTARAKGDNPNGSIAGIASASLDAPNSTKIDITDLPDDVTITASPRMNLKKQYRAEGPVTVDGIIYLRVQYSWWIESWKHDINGNDGDDPDPKLGNEMIKGPVTFIEDPSTVSPNAYLSACTRLSVSTYPYETYNNTYPERSVLDAGTVTCSDTGPTATGPITVTITDADFSLTHVPTETRTGVAISSDRGIASFGVFYINVPVTDISDAGGDISSTNTLSDFNPVSITDIPNLPEDLSDNIVARNLIAGTGNWSSLFRHSAFGEQETGKVWFDPPTTATANWGGDGMIQRGQTFATSSAHVNNSFGESDEVQICSVLDSSLYEYADLDSTPGVAHQVSGANGLASGGEGVGYKVEYGVGYVGVWPPASYPNNAALQLECNDPSVQWFSTLTAARAAGTPTKARFTRLTPQPISSGHFILKNRVRSDITDPNGTLLTHMATYRSSIAGGDWRTCSYNAGAFPTPTQVSNICGDRLILTQSLARIQKTTVPNDFVDVVQAGGAVRYKLAPNFTSANAISDNITVVDTLPAGTVYATNSAVWNGIPFEPTVTGSEATGQTLTWDLGTWDANVPIPSLEFELNVPITTSNGTSLDNTATILAVTDGSSDAQRSDTRTVTVSSPSSIIMAKNTDTPLINQNELIRFNMEYYNGTPNDVNKVDIVDILPYNGDNRTPASSFSGTYVINPVTFESSNATVYYTSLTQASIANDPQDASNDLTTGSTKWCTAAQFGNAGCPAAFANITAFRLIDQNVLLANNSRTLSIELTTSGNFGGEIYTNIAQVSGEGVGLSAYSPYATSRVIEAPELGLAKELTTQDGVDLGFTFVVENLGNTHVTSLNLIDDLDVTFGAGNYAITSMPVVTVQPATGGLVASTTFTGTGGETNLLDPTETNYLPVGTTATLTVGVKIIKRVDLGNGLGVYENTSTTEGTTPSGNTVSDTSDDGAEPDTNNNGDASDADESDPTPITLVLVDWGDAPASMVSLDEALTATYGDASHTLDDVTYLGSLVDFESASQSTGLLADGDNIDGTNDDDGVVFPVVGTSTSLLFVGEANTVTVDASVNGFLNAWIDWNQDGDWNDADETIATNIPLVAGSNSITVTPSVTVPHGATFTRFRFTSTSVTAPSPIGLLDDGEVEDYRVSLVVRAPIDKCDSAILNSSFESTPNPSTFTQLNEDLVEGWGTIPTNPTSSNSFAKRNKIEQWKTGFFGVPAYDGSYFAELNAIVPGMLYQDIQLTPGSTYVWSFAHRARTGTNTIEVWMGAPDAEVQQGSYTSDTTAWQLYTGVYVVPAGEYITRFGFRSGSPGSVGNFIDAVNAPSGCDYGDAPISYGTTKASNGAHHVSNPLLYFGDTFGDSEEDAQPTATALGDDLLQGDDEDAISALASLTDTDRSYAVETVVTNNTGNTAIAAAWIDFDGSGTFDSDEYAWVSVPTGSTNADITLNWSIIPTDIIKGDTFMRLRISTESMSRLDASGGKWDGEVEDYTIAISGASVSGRVFIDANSNTVDDAESGIGGTVVILINTVTGVCESVKTTGGGNYSFAGVVDGSYELYQAHGETTPVPQNCGVSFANNPTGYQSTTADTLSVTVAGSSVTGQDFGEVAGATSTTGVNTGSGITFEPDHQSEVLPGNVVFYAHVFTSEADGRVNFTSSGSGNVTAGWAHLIYRDANCDGVLNGTEGNTKIEGINLGIAAAGRLCIIDKVYAPTNATAQDQYKVETVATFSYAGGALPNTTLKVTDLTVSGQSSTPATGAVESSGLELRKTVENLSEVYAQGLTAGDLETTEQNQAKPGDLLKYRIYYRNTGTTPITDLKVNDTMPSFTGLVLGSPACDSTPSTLGCTPPTSTNALNWIMTGSLSGGASGHVSYEVVVDN